MKKRLFSKVNALLSVLLVVLGFSGCDETNGGGEVMYGTPSVDYHIVGRVTDSSGAPIKGIRITVKGTGTLDEHPDSLVKKRTVYTDEHGNYVTKDFHAIAIDPSLRVVMEDIDGPENGGEFAKDSVMLNQMEQKQQKKRSGWYRGEFEMKADKTLKKK